MLGLIFEDENNIEKACDSYFICADLTKKDSSKWFRAYELSEKLKLHKRQMYCLARLIHLLPDNPSVYEKRARLLLEDDQFSRAFSDLLSCARYAPDPFSLVPELYDLSKRTHRERDLLEFMEQRHASWLARLSGGVV